MIDTPSLVVGAVIAFTVGYIYQRIRDNLKEIKEPNRPMVVRFKTDRTPNQVQGASAVASLRLILWCALLVVVIGGFGLLLYGSS